MASAPSAIASLTSATPSARFSYAAAALGWRAQWVEGLGSAHIAALLGLDRDDDFGRAEREDPDALLQIFPAATAATRRRPR